MKLTSLQLDPAAGGWGLETADELQTPSSNNNFSNFLPTLSHFRHTNTHTLESRQRFPHIYLSKLSLDTPESSKWSKQVGPCGTPRSSSTKQHITSYLSALARG